MGKKTTKKVTTKSDDKTIIVETPIIKEDSNSQEKTKVSQTTKKSDKELTRKERKEKNVTTIQDSAINQKHKINATDAGYLLVLCTILAPVVASILSGIIIALIHVSTDYKVNLDNNIFVMSMQYIIYYGLMLYALVKYAKKFHVDLNSSLKLRPATHQKKVWISIAIGAICTIACAPIMTGISKLFSLIGYNPQSQSMPLNTPLDLILNILCLAIIPAVVEEIIYRGAIYHGLKSKLKAVWAVTLTSVIFMLSHGALQQSVYQLILGFILTYIVYSTNNITYSMIVHLTNNFLVVILSYIQNITTPWTIDFSKWSVICIVIALFIIGAVAVYFLLKLLSKRDKQSDVVEVFDHNIEEQKTTKNSKMIQQKLTQIEKLWLIGGMIILAIIWIAGTSLGF